MSEGLTTKETLEEVQILVDMCFYGNAVLDNVVYQMAISPLNVPNLYEFTHQKLSHSFPIHFADAITDFMIQQNDRIYRGKIDGADKIYSSILDCYKDIVDIFVKVQKQVEACIDTAIDNNDKAVEDFLRDFNVKIATLYVKQAKTIFNAIEQYENAGLLPLFDNNFESFIIIK